MRRLLLLLAALVFALAAFAGGVIVGGHPEATGLTRLSDPLRGILLGDDGRIRTAEVIDILRRDYVEEIDAQALDQVSVDALIESLDDPYTDYLDDDELAQLRERNSGSYVGVGVQLAQRDEEFVITRVFPGGPAARGGLRAGDRLVAVDGTPVGDRTLDQIVAEVRGPSDSSVLRSAHPG